MRSQLPAEPPPQASAGLPTLVSVGGAAKTICSSKSFVRKLIASGDLRVVRIGRRVLVEQESLLQLIERGRQVSR